MNPKVRRVLQWIRMAGRVRYQITDSDLYRVTSPRHKQQVLLTLDELNDVQQAAGAINIGTMENSNV